ARVRADAGGDRHMIPPPEEQRATREWAIVSNNCWGAELYREQNLPYNTPTVGLFFYAEDYLRLLANLRELVREPIRFISEGRFGDSGYPIGVVDDEIEIHFLHYATEEEAFDKWSARSARLPERDEDLYIKICDRDRFTQADLELFDRLPYPNKVAFLRCGR